MMMKNISNIIFQIAETALIFMIGKLLNVPTNTIIFIMSLFLVARLIIACIFNGKPKHYNKWYRCCVWSSLVFTSLYSISNLGLIEIVLLTIFAALISSGKADINDMYMWKNNGEPSKYQDIIEFIKYHPLDDSIYEFEKKLERQDSLMFLVYKYKFKDKKKFIEITNELNISTARLVEMLDKIAFAMRINCKI